MARGGFQGSKISGEQFRIYGESGSPPSETKAFRIRKGDEPPPPPVYKRGQDGKVIMLDTIPIGSGIVETLAPGGTIDETIVLTGFYDLSKPGKYKVDVERTDYESKAVVTSNTITIGVSE